MATCHVVCQEFARAKKHDIHFRHRSSTYYLRSKSLSLTGSYLKALSFLVVVDNVLVAVQGAPPDCKVSFNSLKTHPGELTDPAMVDSEGGDPAAAVT